MRIASHSLCVSPSAEQRIAHAEAFLRALPARSPLLLLLPSVTAGSQLLSRVLATGQARFGWQKSTLDAFARTLALAELAREGRVPLRSLAVEALVTRVVHELAESGRLGRYRELAERPGFVRALAKTLDELRLADSDPTRLAPHAPELATLLSAYDAALVRLGLADRAHVFAAARRALLADPPVQRGRPWLALDVALTHHAEAQLIQALGGRSERAAATVPRGDERSELHFRLALGSAAQVVRSEPDGQGELARLQSRLFVPAAERTAHAASSGGAVTIVSSPGEAREAVEIARRVAQAAARGVPFDRIAVALRAVEGYRAVVEEAFARADIPAHFAEGVRRPMVEGRAFLALLACARDGLSAHAFAEYLSLAAMPTELGEDPPASPRKWERMLLEAAVIGGRERWTRRLAGLSHELADALDTLDADDPRRESLLRDRELLSGLQSFATPLLDALAALPDGGSWQQWMGALTALARLALREADTVCALVAELAPLGPIGPVSTRTVHRVLSARLSSIVLPSPGHGAGKVFVGAIEELRGRSFELVLVMGLAERVFPPRIAEDALLPDAVRSALGPELWLTEERVARERLLLRVAVGAAERELVLSYPRFDLAHGRPRVPSFYGLEVLQAIDGKLPAFDELTRRAHPGAAARMGFPAPTEARDAIDDAEYDLAMLERLMRAPEPERKGAARYLLDENVHLARALRFRARRWELPRFSAADGFVASDDGGRALLAGERLSARSYSASALAQFAACPYRFFLHAIVGIAERPEVGAADELDARQRGVLFHRVQRALLSALRERCELPLSSASLPAARALLAQQFEQLAAQARDDYAPSIDGVFEAGLGGLRRDLGEWLERLVDEPAFVPLHFELGFGLTRGRELDPRSVAEPLPLAAGVRLAGAIDLVERALASGPDERPVLRATDHKTSLAPDKLGITGGGRVLQPLLYALALEQLFPQAKVASGRLYYCTARGEFKSHEVPLDASARAVASELVGSIDAMIEQGFLPAAPGVQPEDRERHECERCAYRAICGPYEAERVAQVKGRELTRLAPLFHLRNLP